MKKFISTLLILLTSSCFTMTIGSFANNSTVASNSSISSICNQIKFGFGTGWNVTKYGAKTTYDWVTGPAWNSTKYGVKTAYDWITGPAWNETKYEIGKAWNSTKYGVGKAGNATKNTWCKYIGWGCGKNNTTADESVETNSSNLINEANETDILISETLKN